MNYTTITPTLVKCELPPGVTMRRAGNADRENIITHIDQIYREYGDQICLENADSDLTDIEFHYPPDSSAFAIFELDDQLTGTLAVVKVTDEVAFYRRLYLKSTERGRGLGDAMMLWGLAQAGAFGCQQVEFWSDTRFTRAHRFFAKHGFDKGATRSMNDGHMPYQEYHFSKRLAESGGGKRSLQKP